MTRQRLYFENCYQHRVANVYVDTRLHGIYSLYSNCTNLLESYSARTQ